jgi:hypothetical protein
MLTVVASPLKPFLDWRFIKGRSVPYAQDDTGSCRRPSPALPAGPARHDPLKEAGQMDDNSPLNN